jgi:hypothetical protein
MSAQHLKKAFDALTAKQKTYKDFYDYYDGDHKMMYTASKLADIFRGMDAYFIENWCAVVIDAVKDRINLCGVHVPNAAKAAWSDLWSESQLDLESDDSHEDLLVAGESFVIVDNDGQAYRNDPRMAHIFYDPARPREKQFGAKWWVNDEGRLRMTLYYPNFIEHYISQGKADDAQAVDAFIAMPGRDARQRNPLQTVPVFHFRMSRRTVRSDLKNVVPVQNAINKLLADMMVAAEFGAFNQRWVISSAENVGQLKNRPKEVWNVPAGDGISQPTQVGQFEATPLENYLKGIEQMAMSTSSITRTPKHYFFSIGSNLSGESLQVMEAPLVKKAQDRIDRCAPVWGQIAQLMLRARGQAVPLNDIRAEYDKPEIVQPRTQAESREINVRAGMPLTTILRDEGKSDAYLEQMSKDKAAQDAAENESLAQSLLASQRRFDQGGGE